MNGELDSLEQKLSQVLALYDDLRGENHALREQVTGLTQRNENLQSRAEAARTRLEVLMERLPAE